MKMKKLIGILKDMPSLLQVKNTRKKYKIIACALDKKGKVLSMKTNDYDCSHPLQKHFAVQVGRPEAIFLHAEIATLIAAKKVVHKLLIARVDCEGNPLPAKPCPICEKAIEAFGVKEVEYT
jgi:deoxycytidylate deaminase